MKLNFIVLVVFILIVQSCFGDDFRYLRTQEGLYNGEITSIAQDRSGKMWFSTWSGLASYNGFVFQFFKPELGNPLSLPDKKTHKIFIDSRDNLWVASLSCVSVFRRSDQTFHTIHLEGLQEKSYYVFNFLESKGYVLIHTNEGVFLIDTPANKEEVFHTKKLKLYNGNTPSFEYVHYLNTFKEQLVIVSNVDAYNPTRILIAELIVNRNDTLINLQRKIVYPTGINVTEYVKEEDQLYLGTLKGISVLSLSNFKITEGLYFKNQNIQNLLYASNRKIYAYSDNPALLYVDLNTRQEGRYLPDPMASGTLLDNNITCLFEDFSGNLWVGHQGLGLSILNLNRKPFYTFKHDPSNSKSLNGNIVMCFNGTAREIFVGMRQGGINITSKQLSKEGTAEFKVISYGQPRGLGAVSVFDNIWDIARESDSVFWVASDGGLAKLEKAGKEWRYGRPGEQPLYTGVVRKVLVDKDHNIWIGTFGEGLIFFPALRKNPKRISYHFPFDPLDAEGISNQAVLSMLIDSKNRFWVGTNNGLNLLKTPYNELDLSGNTKPLLRFQQFVATRPKKDFLNANEINCIFENKDGKIWLATQGGGINILNTSTYIFSPLTTANGLPGNDVQGILPDASGRKWVSTNKGVVSIDLENKEKPFTYYTQSDGLQGETFKVNGCYESGDGEMFFGGDNGFTRFYPREITFNPIAPKIGLTNFRIQNQVVNVGDTISKGNTMVKVLDETDKLVLPFQKNSFSIGVGVHHYQFPGGNRIRYKLDGYNDHWITLSASNSTIYFSKVPDGRYTLHISGISADNIEALQERVLSIRILPPWYKTGAMTSFFLLIVISIIGGAIHIVVRRQRISFEKKIAAIALENNENKMKFLTNIAHELRTPLSLVVAPIEDMMQNYIHIDPKWKEHINLIHRNSNYLLTLINQIIDFRKLNAGKLLLNLQPVDLALLVKEVAANFKGFESRQKAHLQVRVPELPLMVKVDAQKIKEVLYNLLSNAFKHTSDYQSIVVTLEYVSSPGNQQGVKGRGGEEEKGRRGEGVRLTVFNEGKDIADVDKEKIFERFYKVSEKVEGAGIGLSYAKSLVEMHQGSIYVESVMGAGVAFHVLLPIDLLPMDLLPIDEIEALGLRAVENENPEFLGGKKQQVDEQLMEAQTASKSLTLVIVEDNTDLRTFLKNTLSVTYHCLEASDGREGYELISRIVPDIVISDVIMPRMDGYELCEKIKENSKTCHIPIILLTANNASEHIISGYSKGADAYITKPFDMTIVKAQISRLIKNRELIREKYMTHNFMVEVSTSNMSRDDEFIIRLRKLLENNLTESDFNVKKLSADLTISTTHLYRKLKALTGLSPVEFIRIFKLQKACELLSNSNLSIKEIGYSVGFNNLSYFVKCFREQFAVTPSVYRQNGMPEATIKNNTNQPGVA